MQFTTLTRLFVASTIAVAGVSLTGCEDDNDIDLSDNVESAADRAGDNTERAAENVGDAVNRAGDNIQDAAD